MLTNTAPMTSDEFHAAAANIAYGVWRLMMHRGAQGLFDDLTVAGTRIHCGMDQNAVRLALSQPLRRTEFADIRELLIRFPA
jgi:hypothetical protein